MLVVWEPILNSDREPPKNFPDFEKTQVQQFWDPEHRVSRALLASPAIAARHVDDDGVVWDAAFLFAPGARWEEAPPDASFAGAPVIRAHKRLREALP